MVYVDGRGCWELNLYSEVADAMRQAAIEEGVPVQMGMLGTLITSEDYDGTMEEATDVAYIDLRLFSRKAPFLDEHFELA